MYISHAWPNPVVWVGFLDIIHLCMLTLDYCRPRQNVYASGISAELQGWVVLDQELLFLTQYEAKVKGLDKRMSCLRSNTSSLKMMARFLF